jgi:hypothetical protein
MNPTATDVAGLTDLSVAWLKTLKSEINRDHTQKPILPASGPKTLRPDLNRGIRCRPFPAAV